MSPPRPAGPRAVVVFDGMCSCHWTVVIKAPEHRCREVMRLVAGTGYDPTGAEDWPGLWARLLAVDGMLRGMERERRRIQGL